MAPTRDMLSTSVAPVAGPCPDLLGNAVDVAPRLLGCLLVRRLPGGGQVGGVIVETEAYPGGADTASHSAGGRRTPRNESMWRRGGHLYVYFTYGMHWCLNVVTGPEGSGEAVLVRALEPRFGIESMRRRRRGHPDRDLARGPARLCQALAIDGSHDRLWLADPASPVGLLGPPSGERPGAVACGPRIGIERHGAWARRRWRFWVRDSRFVSGSGAAGPRERGAGSHP